MVADTKYKKQEEAIGELFSKQGNIFLLKFCEKLIQYFVKSASYRTIYSTLIDATNRYNTIMILLPKPIQLLYKKLLFICINKQNIGEMLFNVMDRFC